MAAMLLRELVDASAAVRATSARGGKVERLAELLRHAEPGRDAGRGRVAVGRADAAPDRRRLGDAARPAAARRRADAHGRRGARRRSTASARCPAPARRPRAATRCRSCSARATEDEQRFLTALLLGDIGQGALAGVMTDAVAKAADVPKADVRRALMLRGDLGAVAAVALAEGAAGLAAISLELLRPVQPMLAAPGDDVDAALERISPAAVEFKLDGMRVQVHRRGDEVRVFTRTLDDITARVPEVVEAARAAADRRRGARRRGDRAAARRPAGAVPGHRQPASASGRLSALFFDVLHAGGEDLIDRPGAERFEALAELVPEAQRVPRAVAADADAARAVLDDALARGHEGVLVKSLDAPYAAGRRGAGWLKVKPRHTLDLVVLAAEWGHGRRRGWLSNLHLGAREPDGPGLRDARQDVQGPDRRDAHVADRARCSRSRPAATTGPSTCGRSWWSRSRSTACRRAAATRAASRCGSRACSATGPTSRRPRPTRSTPCWRIHASGA